MEDADFEEALEAADDPIDENAKMTVAKGVFDDACLNTSQIYRVAELFIDENRRLEFAKFAYSRTSDKSKYFKLNKLFIDENRVTELTNYVKQYK